VGEIILYYKSENGILEGIGSDYDSLSGNSLKVMVDDGYSIKAGKNYTLVFYAIPTPEETDSISGSLVISVGHSNLGSLSWSFSQMIENNLDTTWSYPDDLTVLKFNKDEIHVIRGTYGP